MTAQRRPLPARPRKVPSTVRLLWRGVRGRCPACGARGQYRWLVNVSPSCHNCGLQFERIEGHFVGAVGMNTIMSLGILLISLLVSIAVTYPDFPVLKLMLANIAVAIAAPLVCYPLSRMLWTGIDIAMRPLGPDEVDWAVVLGSVNKWVGHTDMNTDSGNSE